ncbi:DNA-binding protein modulo [Drosophila mauritiana]|uniref:DNA-binding protein modulo n=1 Tax=Drosophila mauritiana TaxID=7226 RepID=A0A6P8KU51_DROMA|nr:DNA-binding protein modulo [Drosophila mauritiana]
MAQKKAVTIKGKKAINGEEKPLAKRVTKSRKVQEEETVVAQSPSKKSKKQPVKEVPQSSEEDESDVEEQNDEQAEDDSDFETEEAADLIDDEAEEDEEYNSDDEDDDDDELEPGEVSKSEGADEVDESDGDDEAPVEKPVSKKSEKANSEKSEENIGIPKIKVGKIPLGTPQNQIVFVTNLPNEYLHKELVALFAKFGRLSALQRFTNMNGNNSVLIAFDTSAGAQAVLQAKPKALTLGDNVLSVSEPRNKEENNERTVVVGLIGPNITKDDLKTVFEKVAPVEAVTISSNRLMPKAFVRLASVDDIPKALKLHSTELFSRFITVRRLSQSISRTSELTLVVENVGKHESYSSDTLEKIFKKFGDVEEIDVVCSKAVLAFVTFKQSDAAAKALAQLDGKTVNKVEWKLHRFERCTSGRSILVTNLTSDATEADLRKIFNESGEIESIIMFGQKAVVKFKDDEGFCKSFLANESIVNNAPIFIEPNSQLKHRLLKKRLAISKAHAPRKFQKDTKPNFGKKPFNKRPAQENGGKSFVKRARF